MDNAIRLTRSYIARLAGCASCMDTRLAMCADEKGYRTKHLAARRALISSELALKGIQLTQNAVWSRAGDFNSVVQHEGGPAMTATGYLDLTIERLAKAEEHIAEYLESPTAAEEDKLMMEGLLGWVRHCHWELNDIRDSPKPAINFVVHEPPAPVS